MRNSTHSEDDRLHTEDLLTDSTAAESRESTVDEHGSADRRPGAGQPDFTDRPGSAGFGRSADASDTYADTDTDRAAGEHALTDRSTHSDTDRDESRTDADRAATDRTDADTDRADWDGAPTYDAGPPVDQTRSHGYADASPASATPTEEIPAQREQREAGTPAATEAEEPGAQLFSSDEVERFRTEWSQVQANFVDDPREAVQSADHLVAEVMQNLAKTFADHKKGLEGQWRDGDGEAATEDLRQALRRYRSFFNQLLHT